MRAAERLAADPAVLILDVRTPGEYASGHLKGAVLAPVDELPDRMASLPQEKTKPILVYCAAGPRSKRAGAFLASRGYARVSALLGGLGAWEAAGLPVVKEGP